MVLFYYFIGPPTTFFEMICFFSFPKFSIFLSFTLLLLLSTILYFKQSLYYVHLVRAMCCAQKDN